MITNNSEARLAIEKANKLLGTTNYAGWSWLSTRAKLSEDFIREFQRHIDWYAVSTFQILSEDFIREFQHKIIWSRIAQHQKLSEDFIREFQDRLDWRIISAFQKLSEDFIREFQFKVDWINISKYQKLSEDFIKKFKNKVSLENIFKYQKISEGFIKKFKNKINSNNYYTLLKYQKLSDKLIKEIQNNIKIENNVTIDFNVYNHSWLYKDIEFKKQQIIESGLYECYDDYFIAYKGIRRDRYSNYNFQYQYLPGNIYESWCDCTAEESSFGLSIWTKEKAASYCSDLIVKVKVKYEDVGRLVHDGGKIRCFKIEVLD